MDQDKKIFRLDLSIALEASDEEEAFDLLMTEDMVKQLQQLIIQSKGNIQEMFKKENEVTIIN